MKQTLDFKNVLLVNIFDYNNCWNEIKIYIKQNDKLILIYHDGFNSDKPSFPKNKQKIKEYFITEYNKKKHYLLNELATLNSNLKLLQKI